MTIRMDEGAAELLDTCTGRAMHLRGGRLRAGQSAGP